MYAEKLLAIALGVAPIAYAAHGWSRFRRPARWPVVQGLITRSRIVEIGIDIGEGRIKGWEPRIEFTYPVGEANRTGNSLGLDDAGFQYTNHLSAQRFIARYPAGLQVAVHLSPEGRAVLLADVTGAGSRTTLPGARSAPSSSGWPCSWRRCRSRQCAPRLAQGLTLKARAKRAACLFPPRTRPRA